MKTVEPVLLFWEQTSDYWDLPFYTEMGLFNSYIMLPLRDDWTAAREQLFAMRELDEEAGEEVPGLNLESNNQEAAKETSE